MREATLYRLAADILVRLSTAYNDSLGDLAYDLKEREGGWDERSKTWGRATSQLKKILPELRAALDRRNTNLGRDSEGYEAFFEANGSTLVFNPDGEQVGQAQGGWVTVFAEFLDLIGLEPTKMRFTLPNGMRAKITVSEENGFGWEVTKD